MTDLRTKTARKRLNAKGTPYAQKLAEGRALLYRKRSADNPGRWLLRTYNSRGRYDHETLGTADDVAEADGKTVLSYAQALDAALGRNTADPTRVSVQQALNEWAEWKSRTVSSPQQDAGLFATARRIGEAFPKATLRTISAREIDAWMFAGDAAPATRNRRLATLKAALTRAADWHGYQGERGWQVVKKIPKTDAHNPRMVILSEAEEAQWIAAARPDVARLLTALQMTGARYGELRQCLVGDLDGSRLSIRNGKTGPRIITLSPDRAEWFRTVAGNRRAGEPLLIRKDGSGWYDGGHKKPVATSVAQAGLTSPEGNITSYCLRHGFITRALAGGVPTVAVAQHCGTSVGMIESNYAKFAPDVMAEWFS